MTTEHTEVRSGKSKRKPFNSNVADYLLIIATFAFSYPLVLSDTSNIERWSAGFGRWTELGLVLGAARAAQSSRRASEFAQVRSRRNCSS
jgi:hypothetical protein